MTAPFGSPRSRGPSTLAPEIERIVEALARAQEERDYRAKQRGELQTGRFAPPTPRNP